MAQNKKYTIAGRVFSQSPLTLRKDQELFEVISEVGLKDVSDFGNMTIAQIINLLFAHNVLVKLLKVILIPDSDASPLSDDDILDLSNDFIQEIIEDFFMLNPKLLTLLKGFAGKLAGTNLTTT